MAKNKINPAAAAPPPGDDPNAAAAGTPPETASHGETSPPAAAPPPPAAEQKAPAKQPRWAFEFEVYPEGGKPSKKITEEASNATEAGAMNECSARLNKRYGTGWRYTGSFRKMA